VNESMVSVIMGVYNPPIDQLQKAVRSIIRQTYLNWELLIYDDGSDLAYQEEIVKLADLDPRIACYRGDSNQGLAKALNECISRAGGTYIARMDGDDISHKERLVKQIDFLEHHPEFDWVGTGVYLLAGKSFWGTRKMPSKPRAEDFLRYSPYIHPTVVFRKEVLSLSQGYTVSPKTRRCEDYELFMRLHSHGYRGYNLSEYLFAYREDIASYARRTWQSRCHEMQIRYQGFKRLGILRLTTIPYLVRPLIGGLIIKASPSFLGVSVAGGFSLRKLSEASKCSLSWWRSNLMVTRK